MDQGTEVKHPMDLAGVSPRLISLQERNQIIETIKEGKWKKLKSLLDKCFQKDKEDQLLIGSDKKQVIHVVAELGDTNLMTHLIVDYKLNVNVVDNNGRSSLHYAIVAGHYAMVENLLRHKANQFVQETSTKYQPIHFAAQTGDDKMISLLLSKQSDEKQKMDQISDAGTPLEVAVRCGHVKAVKLFLDHKYKDVFYEQDENALMLAVRSDCLDIVKLLVKDGGFLANQRCSGETPLGLAASIGKLEIMKWLIEHGNADPNVPNKVGLLPLEVAVLGGDTSMVNFLLTKTTQVEPYINWSAEGLSSLIRSKEAKAQWYKRRNDVFNHHRALALGDAGLPCFDEKVWYNLYQAHKLCESHVETLAYLCFCKMVLSKHRDGVDVEPDITTAYTVAGKQYAKNGKKELAGKAFRLSHELKERRIKMMANENSALPTENGQVGDAGTSDSSAINDSTQMSSSQILSMQETIKQFMTRQQEMQKQMTEMASIPVTEGKRVETALGRNMDKAIKANTDALWARMQEEFAKRDMIERDHTQQMTSLISKSVKEDLRVELERILKKELATMDQTVAHLITPSVESVISSSIMEAFQRGVGDKAVTQLEKSISAKLEPAIARQIQAQFQSSGKQVLQDALMSSLEALVIPAFEMSCKAMFEQVDGVFQKGLSEHTMAVLKQLESTHSPLALTLRGAINSATSITQSLTGELADGQRKLIALAAAGANSKAVNPLVTQLSNGPMSGLHEMVETVPDPIKELSRLISERKFEEAFNGALQRSDVSIVSWLCSQVDLQGILSMVPLPLSQGVLLALLQQLACDINKETSRKLTWMKDVAVAINPLDPMIVVHVRPIFEQVYQILGHHRSLATTTPTEANSIRLLMHVINSMLTSCK